MAILDGFNVTGENENFLFGLNADTVFFDSTSMTFKTGVFGNNDVTAPPGSLASINEPLNEIMPMPVAGRVIGLIYIVTRLPSTPTMNFNIFVNGIEVASDLMLIPSLLVGNYKSETLNIPFNAGDQVVIERTRSGSTTDNTQGVFGMAVNWD